MIGTKIHILFDVNYLYEIKSVHIPINMNG